MALISNISATNNSSTLNLDIEGNNLVASCNGYTYNYDLEEILDALAGVSQQNATGSACGQHNLTVTSACRGGDLTLCGAVINDVRTVVCKVHGVRYDFPLDAARSGIQVARSRAIRAARRG